MFNNQYIYICEIFAISIVPGTYHPFHQVQVLGFSFYAQVCRFSRHWESCEFSAKSQWMSYWLTQFLVNDLYTLELTPPFFWILVFHQEILIYDHLRWKSQYKVKMPNPIFEVQKHQELVLLLIEFMDTSDILLRLEVILVMIFYSMYTSNLVFWMTSSCWISNLTLSHTILHTPFLTLNFVTHHLSHTTMSHTIFHTPFLTLNFVTHHLDFVTHHLWHAIFHTTLSHTIFHTPSLTHHLSHTTLSHTIFRHTTFHTPLCHTPSFTHNFVTRSLSHTTFTHTIFHRQLCHTHHLSLSHTIFRTQLCHTQLCFTSRSSTTSFVFPSFPVPATTCGAHYWKKLPCGVIRSFNYLFFFQKKN